MQTINRCLFSLLLALNLKASASFLVEHFKELKNNVPHITLAQLPTPIHRCSHLEKTLKHFSIFMKRDDLTGFDHLYGGNKVRKLEFLLADALQKGARKIITFGCVGSNHAVATACYSQTLGLDCLLMLKDQPNSTIVRQNLLLDIYFNAKIALYPNNRKRDEALKLFTTTSNDTYFISTGGSTPLGALGYVNAAFELKNQIEQGIMPEPDIVYVPVGSCGTTAGLLLGFKLAKIKSKIIAVTIEPKDHLNEIDTSIHTLFFETNALLQSLSSSIPLMQFPHEQLSINRQFCGTEYGLWLPSGNKAMHLMLSQEKITLEGTYSAKACAALIADIKNRQIKRDQIILLWNTYCGIDFSSITNQIDYHALAPNLQKYFE